MSVTLIPSISGRLDDPDIERARRNLDERITQIQGLPFSRGVVVGPFTLKDTIATTCPHNLGVVPRWVGVSVVRGATSTGRIVQSPGATKDSVILTATGHGADITVDLVVL